MGKSKDKMLECLTSPTEASLHAYMIIETTRGRPDKLKGLIRGSEHLLKMVTISPYICVELIRLILKNPDEYRRLIHSANDIRTIARYCPKQAEELFFRVATNPEEFNRIIKNARDLCLIAEVLPTYTQTICRRLLENPEEFERIVGTEDKLTELAKLFPGNPIFTVPTAKDAVLKVNASKKDITNSAQAMWSDCRFFSADIVGEIASYTGDPIAHDGDMCQKFAAKAIKDCSAAPKVGL